jgi:hypothetical protein
MPDFIPADDDAFNTYLQDQFGPYVAANVAALGLAVGDNTDLQALVTSWSYSWISLTNYFGGV